MGQKTNPVGLRLGITRSWNSRWFAKGNFGELLNEDLLIRKYINMRLPNASIANIEIERTTKKVFVNIHTARPGIVIGKKGEEVERLKMELNTITKKEIYLNIKEIKRPETDAKLVADNIAFQLTRRVAFRRAMKKAISSAMRMGAKGIKIICSGRLGGAEMSRVEQYKEGRVPLHTLRAQVDFARSTAHTTFGCIGVKVWIFYGEKIIKDKKENEIKESA
ncbi:MAG: 30S ribosomal protein S3 [Elusimicrobiota bacterium]